VGNSTLGSQLQVEKRLETLLLLLFVMVWYVILQKNIMPKKTVLTHGFSRAVLGILLHAMDSGKIFSVIVTESRPDDAGYQTTKRLHDAKIPGSNDGFYA
jgi:hypothetical protein